MHSIAAAVTALLIMSSTATQPVVVSLIDAKTLSGTNVGCATGSLPLYGTLNRYLITIQQGVFDHAERRRSRR